MLDTNEIILSVAEEARQAGYADSGPHGNKVLADVIELDVRFRAADFQIMDIVGDRKRGFDWRRR